MKIWAEALATHQDKMSVAQLQAAVNWFRDYSEAVLEVDQKRRKEEFLRKDEQ